MLLKKIDAPFWRNSDTAKVIRRNKLIACSLLLILPTLVHGMRVLLLTAAVVATCVATEIVMCLFMRRDVRISDLDSIVIGVMISVMMPANVAYYVPAMAAVFAIAVAKMPFGGTGHAPFSPAAAGVVFSTLCFPNEIFTYCSADAGKLGLNIFSAATVKTSPSLLALLDSYANTSISYWDVLTGHLAGPIATASVLVLIGAAMYLFFQRCARWEITAAFLIAAVVMASFNIRISGDWMRSVVCEICSGSLLFCAIFLATEYSTTPDLPAARVVYGVLGGVLTMLLRWFGAYEQMACFSILLMNAVAGPLDRLMWKIMEGRRTCGKG